MPETLYLTVNLIDRFLEAKQVTRKHLQLVGVTAMLVASKYEEIWAPEVRNSSICAGLAGALRWLWRRLPQPTCLPCQDAACILAVVASDSLLPLCPGHPSPCLCPQVRDFVYISDRAYTRDQILNMEKIMLNALRFNLTVPSECQWHGRGGLVWSRWQRTSGAGQLPGQSLLTVPGAPRLPPLPPRRHLQLPGPVSFAGPAGLVWCVAIYLACFSHQAARLLTSDRDSPSSPWPCSNFKAAGVVNNKDVTLLATYLVELSLVDYNALKVRRRPAVGGVAAGCMAALGWAWIFCPALLQPPLSLLPLPAPQYPYSMIAAAATYVAMKAVGAADAFPTALERHSGYNVPAVQNCALYLAGLMRKAPVSRLRGVGVWSGD